MFIAVAPLLICTVISAENFGQRLNNFVNDVGKGAEKLANEVADSVDRFVSDNEDLDMQRRAENQQAIDAYRRGEINEQQLRTAMWISQYEYQQAVDDRIRNKYAGGNSYGGYYGTPPAYGNQPGYSNSYPIQRDQGYGSYNGNPSSYSNGYGSQGYSGQAQGYNANPYGSNGYGNPTGNGQNGYNAGTTTYYDPGNGIGIFDKKKKLSK